MLDCSWWGFHIRRHPKYDDQRKEPIQTSSNLNQLLKKSAYCCILARRLFKRFITTMAMQQFDNQLAVKQIDVAQDNTYPSPHHNSFNEEIDPASAK